MFAMVLVLLVLLSLLDILANDSDAVVPPRVQEATHLISGVMVAGSALLLISVGWKHYHPAGDISKRPSGA